MDESLPHRIEVFVGGCPFCRDAVNLVYRLAPDPEQVLIWDVRDDEVAGRARGLGVRAVPAVLVDGEIVKGAEGQGPDEAAIRSALA